MEKSRESQAIRLEDQAEFQVLRLPWLERRMAQPNTVTLSATRSLRVL